MLLLLLKFIQCSIVWTLSAVCVVLRRKLNSIWFDSIPFNSIQFDSLQFNAILQSLWYNLCFVRCELFWHENGECKWCLVADFAQLRKRMESLLFFFLYFFFLLVRVNNTQWNIEIYESTATVHTVGTGNRTRCVRLRYLSDRLSVCSVKWIIFNSCMMLH